MNVRDEVGEILKRSDDRELDRLAQAVRDAYACKESRRAGWCDCYCCSVAKELAARGWEIYRFAFSSQRSKL